MNGNLSIEKQYISFIEMQYDCRYPNEYSVGITSLGYQLVWAFLEMHPSVHVTRFFTDISESVNVRATDLLGFSFSWELDYSNILDILERLNIPILSENRTDNDPLVFGGGTTLTANPEPYAAFFDIVLLGDGEEMLNQFIECYLKIRSLPREEKLAMLSQLDGIYVPSFYEPSYNSDGDFIGMDVIHSAAPPVVKKQTYRGEQLASSQVVSPRMAWESIFMVSDIASSVCMISISTYK